MSATLESLHPTQRDVRDATRPDVAPCSTKDNALAWERRGRSTRDYSLSSFSSLSLTVAEIKIKSLMIFELIKIIDKY